VSQILQKGSMLLGRSLAGIPANHRGDACCGRGFRR
jgi:hypothetical protein